MHSSSCTKELYNKHLKKGTKISVYRAVVLTTPLYGSESWVTYYQYLQLLERFHQCCLHTILNIHWSDVITNIGVFEQVEVTSIGTTLLKTQLCWTGHISRMEDRCLPKIVLNVELSTGHHDRGALKKRYKNFLKKSLGVYHIGRHQWSALASDCVAQRHAIHQSVSTFENARRADLEVKRRWRKNHDTAAPNQEQNFPCCSQACLSCTGLDSYQQACSRYGQPPS
ncbi:uncharacterized protein [Narcine bancroftii]|uniref:uncharacterized protein n=1 Tax=Narcine bancroftii TaxID=1343680 RepID=UPI00383159C7